jgi:HB1/ASXL restriction endonuclease-like protein with HTH domain
MTASRQRLTFEGAALKVLRETGRPMTTRELADTVLRRKLVETRGKTPDATIAARLYGLAQSTKNPGIVRLAEPGPTRARRGSVRWSWRPGGGPRDG